MNTTHTWEKSLSLLEGKLGAHLIDSWFRPIVIESIIDNDVCLEVPNRFFKEWIEERHLDDLTEVLGQTARIGNPIIKWKFSHKEADTAIKKIEVKQESRKAKLANRGIFLNPKYIFSSFVVGSSNQFAHAASTAVAENPGKNYNPLFIYGGSGLGKSHLLNAVGNFLVDGRKGLKILCLSAEQFTNDVVYSIRHSKMEEFRKRYRNLDVFLVDDIHFIAGKERTQEEFFHTFNTLYESEKQIIMTSDRFPNEIPSITDRLRSRFNWGLIADIQVPDLETRIAILEKKAENEGIPLPKDVADYVARNIRKSVRDLEGGLIRLGAYASLGGKQLTVESAGEILRGIIQDKDKPITVDFIQKTVSDYFGLKVAELKSRKRTKEVAFPRQVAMYLCKQLTELSLADIGNGFGGKDHSTVIHACKQIRNKMESNVEIGRKVRGLTERIKGERL